MLYIFRRIALGIVLAFLSFSIFSDDAPSHDAPSHDVPSHGALPYPVRLAAVQPGSSVFFRKNLYNFLKGLEALHLVQFDEEVPNASIEVDINGKSIADLWDWASEHNKSNKIVFLKDGFYDGNFDTDKIEVDLINLRDRIAEKKDIDVVLALGTLVGRYLVNSNPVVPLIVIGSVDPVRGRIAYSEDDSGNDMVTTLIFKDMQKDEVEVFYDKIRFKNMGIMYENSVGGRSYSGIDPVIKVLNKKGVKVAICYTIETQTKSETEREQSILDCVKKLSTTTDAIYITAQMGSSTKSLEEIVKITRENKVPVFIQFDNSAVEKGFLMSYFPRHYYEEVGLEYARRLQLIMSGVKPRSIKQVYEFKDIVTCYNRETAALLNIDITGEKCVY